MINQIQKAYFQEAYKVGNHLWHFIPPGKEAEDFLRLVKKHKSKGKMIDLGCGNGKFAIFFAKKGFDGYGIDYAPEAIKGAKDLAKKEKVGNKTHFKVGDVLDIKYPANFFDVAYDYGCLHHITKAKWNLYLKNLLRVLKPDGFFELSAFSKNRTEHFGFKPGKSKRNWVVHKHPGKFLHYDHFFTKQEIIDLFSKDFKIIKIEEKRLDLHAIFKKTKLEARIKKMATTSFPVLFYVQMRRKG